ncbi:GntR family transcriptional regulator [Microvirga guangxiensis]|uniref:GntR family transcriptional regulator n=1 Tax=Microvirga guangxiensis TaxID=549386 RepID=UPI000B815B65|nr:GntR family transcriptional regulator [Microvirga guangxiensis]
MLASGRLKRTAKRATTEKRTVSTATRVAEVLQEQIASQQLPPGSRLQEAQLAAEFGSSRTIIREALNTLEQRGLVLRIPNRGSIVKRLEEKEVHEIFEIREALEGLATYKATLLAPEGAWRPFIDEFEGPLKERIADGDIDAYNDALERLRAKTIQLSDNDIGKHFLNQILDRARVIKIRVTLLPGRAEFGREMHLRMLRSMEDRDAEGAQRCKREIIRTAKELFGKYKSLIL